MIRSTYGNLKQLVLSLSVLCSLLTFSLATQASTPVSVRPIGLEALPVQDAGRIKPFDTFARETLQLIWGREKFNGKKATDVVFSWMLVPEQLENEQIILIRHAGLREALQLDNERLYYSVGELMTNARLGLLMQDLRSKRDLKEKMDPFFQAVQTLESQITLFQAIRLGMTPGVAPVVAAAPVDPANPAPPDKWQSPSQLQGDHKDKFAAISKSFIRYISNKSDKSVEASAEPVPSIEDAVGSYVGLLEAEHGDYSSRNKISAEVYYNSLHPFLFSWLAYLVASILFAVILFTDAQKLNKYAWGAVSFGFVFHLIGFATRIYITGHAPVTNMYETVVWVALGTIMISSVLYKFFKNTIMMLAATMAATLCLILCDISNHVLDGSMNPLEPVLRDNFWLTTHVLTITLSYAAFFLAFFVGDITLFYYLKDEKKYADKIAQASNAMYRAIQVGVVLLAGGVILGGIWADYSWGRFWGWDPKETWAFIALMGYIAILHGRLAGWLRNFGLATTSVLAFSLVVMAWYGVNFVLGAGLHTYGFGAGGVEWVAAFVAAHVLFVIYVTTLRQSRLKQSITK